MLKRIRMRHCPPGAHKRDERGSLIVAMSVIMVVVAVVSVFGALVIGNQMLIVHRQHNYTGLAAAEAGVADALFRIDQITDPTSTSSFCVGTSTCTAGSVAPGSVPGLPTNSSAQYTATYDDVAGTWQVTAKGTTLGVSAAIQETLSQTEQFPYAVFGNQGLDFDGRASGTLTTYTPGNTSVDPQCTSVSPTPTPSGCHPIQIGSNGTISCNGSLPANITYWIWSGGGGLSDCQSANSTNTTQSSTLYNIPVQTTWPKGAQQLPSCSLGSGASTPVSSIGPGDWYCTSEVTISGNLTVSPQTRLYIIVPTNDPAYTGTVLDIAASSTINYSGSGPLPSSQDFQIYSNSRGTVGDSNGQGYTFAGILDAPDASLTGNGCKSTYYGALIINTLTCNGGPNLTVYYDNSVSAMKGPWLTSGYKQVSPNSFSP